MTMSTGFSGIDSHSHLSSATDGRRGPLAFVLLVLALALAGLALAIKTWGLVALGLVALTMVPVMFGVLIALTLGK